MDSKDLQSYYDGYSIDAYKIFGCHLCQDGAIFRLYAPNAKSVRIIGDFNNWDTNANYLLKSDYGFWEVKIIGAKVYDKYKYLIEDQKGKVKEKIDPFGFYFARRPDFTCKIVDLDNYRWHDENWMDNRSRNYDKPVNIYECHLGGFDRASDGQWLNYYQMIDRLIPYVKKMGYTHIELMPLNEYGLDASWGYQSFGYYALTSRYGSYDQFMMFVDACHQNNIGIIMDIVPVHFVKDEYGLIDYDGCHLFESDDAGKRESSWGTRYFDFSKGMVKSFLMSSAALWLDKYHIDGLRLDAISNLIYFQGNKNLGENKEGISFIKRFNYYIHQKFPTVMTIAEDSSDYPKVTSLDEDGLGFDYKWDLGWMNDTLKYYSEDAEYRHYDHNLINFSMAYFYSERFLLPFSHDEVVHSKKTIIDKMWGDYEAKFAQCRNLMVYMYSHPGKKLNFMGNEFASFREFDEEKPLDWFMLSYPIHDSFLRLSRDLNEIYRHKPAFWQDDYNYKGFRWIDADNAKQRVYSFVRFDQQYCYVVVLNMSPVGYHNFEIGVPTYGFYCEIINSEKDIYGGCNMCNFHKVRATKGKMHNYNYHMAIDIAPYGAMIFEAKMK